MVIRITIILLTFFIAVHTAEASPSLWNSNETKFNSIKGFLKWTGVIKRYKNEPKIDCEYDSLSCPLNVFSFFLNRIADDKKRDQLFEVNRTVNRGRYISDSRNWGMSEYWATPKEFLMNGGDCEDFAIAKFFALKRLGWTDDELRIVVVDDTNINQKHAVLVAELNGEYWVLDNQYKQLKRASDIDHYKPVFSINEANWWYYSTND